MEELHKHEPIISCCCCKACTTKELHAKGRDTNKLHDFLMGLYADFYGPLRTTILSTDPLPSLDRAFQLVAQDERVRLAHTTVKDKAPDMLGVAVSAGCGRG